MALRIAATLLLLLAIIPSAAGQTFWLEGQITSGTTLFTADEPLHETEYDGLGFPEGGYPVEYAAVLTLDAEQQSWVFRFRATDAVETVEHRVSGPLLTSGNIATNNLVITADQVSIDASTFSQQFALDLDLIAETGSWNWSKDCPVCDLSHALPSAIATVDTIRVIPEPNSLIFYAVASAALVSLRYRGRGFNARQSTFGG